MRPVAFLAGILILILGSSMESLAAAPDPCAVPGTCIVTSVVIKNNALADNNHYDIIQVTVTYAAAPHLPVVGTTISFTPQGATASQPFTTGAGGIIDYPTGSFISGLNYVSMSSPSGDPIPASPVAVNFIMAAGPPDPTNPNDLLYVDVTGQLAGGSTPDVIHAHLEDANSNPASGVAVTFFLQSGGGTAGTNAVYPVTVLTDAQGNATCPITDITAGTVILGASYVVAGTTYTFSNAPVSVNFIVNTPSPNPPPGTPNGTVFYVSQDGATADGSGQDYVTAHISDNFGNNVPDGTLVTITITGNGSASGGAELPGNVKTITVPTVNGNAVVPITDIMAGPVEISAAINGTQLINGSPQIVHFVVGAPVPVAPGAPTGPPTPGNPSGTTGTLLSVVGDGAIADNVAEDSVKVHITDANGNPVPNTAVTITIMTGGTPGTTTNALFSNGTQTITVTTDASGNFDIPITDITMGSVWINASISPGGLINGSHVVVNFVAGPPVPIAPGAPTGPSTPGNPTGTTGTFLTIIRDSVGADGIQSDSVNAHITDQYGNAVANVPVTFTITTGGTLAAGVAQLAGNVQTITLMTDANGNIGANIISGTAGTVSIVASINGGSLINNSPRTVTFLNVPDVTNPNTQLIVVVYEALADGTEMTVVKAHVVDQNGVSLPNQDIIFSIDSGKATIITPQPWTTDGNGDATIYLVSKTPGYVLITATVGGKSITFGSPARVKFAGINIYVPRVFTPNGDGTNDVLKPILVGIANFHYFSVYNRWGNLIFTSEDPNGGWDGRFKGVAQPVETYLWIAEGIDINGTKVVQKGMVSLVR